MKKALVIVESPAKARTVSKCLGSGFIVESSIGHIRDLPSNASEIPARYKAKEWARLGVDVEDDFKPIYVIPRGKAAQVKKLKASLKQANELFLATDIDREGEAIAWHLVNVLKPKCSVKRMTFEEITESAILRAVKQTREIDSKLVDAQETRRILDRLYGYGVSPILWRKVMPKLSAGRVQSVATRLVVDRERARMRFVRAEYWGVEAELEGGKPPSKRTFTAKLVELAGKKIATGKDFDETTGCLKQESKAFVLEEQDAHGLTAGLASAEYTVADVAEKPFKRKPYPPFITSSLQQEAARKLRFSAHRTMGVAQKLYENGFITYMRTDSTQLSTQAVAAARKQAASLYGEEYIPQTPRVYTRKSKNAQEAHEAIRPAGESFRTPESLKGELDYDGFRLYELIWKRTVASQMKDASGLHTKALIHADTEERGLAVLSASGRVISFPGFLRAYVEGSDDPLAELADVESILPPLAKGQELDPAVVKPVQHSTQPPARYTEASLIKELEERGIGRPSTYATILQTIQARGYIWKNGTALVPKYVAFAVIQLLEKHFAELVNYDFTARMEEELDDIANGRSKPVPWLKGFYFGKTDVNSGTNSVARIGLEALIEKCDEGVDARAISSIVLGKTEDGEEVAVRVGRYGPYVQIGDSDKRANVPDDVFPDEFAVENAMEKIRESEEGDQVLGTDPETSKPVYLKKGRFGPYVQLGDAELNDRGKIKKGTKPKMASLWPSMSPDLVTLEDALMLLSFPRKLGSHPETGEPVTVQDGRYGPYVKSGKESRSLSGHEQLKTITFEQALDLLKQPKRVRSGTAAKIAELGNHPESEKAVLVKSGRYGPYVTDGEVNASLPKGGDPLKLTLDEAVNLLKAREQKMKEQGKKPRRKAKRNKTQ